MLSGSVLPVQIWGGIIASPVIGLSVGLVTYRTGHWTALSRLLLSLATLYLAAALWGFSIGALDILVLDETNQIRSAIVIQTVLILAAGKMRIVRQILTPGPTPEFGPPKNGQPRTVSLASETITLLRAHKRQQARVKMANRTTYADPKTLPRRQPVRRQVRGGVDRVSVSGAWCRLRTH